MEYKFELVNSLGNCVLCTPVSLEVALKVYRIMTAPPYLEPNIYLYLRAVEVTV